MIRDHTTIEELLSIQALGGLDGEDAARLERERAAHGDCEECRRLEVGFAETAGRLGFALDPVPVDAAMAERILAEPRGGASRMEPSGSRRWRIVVGVAAAFVVLVGGLAVFLPRTTGIGELASGQRVVRFQGGPGSNGELAMAYTPGEPGAVFWGRDMPSPGAGKVYEIWMIDGTDAVSGGCVTPVDGTVAFSVTADVGTADLMAVTREPTDCPGTPSETPVMTAPLTV